MKKCVLILARGGSKGIKRKNLVKINNKTLLAYVIDAANESDIDDVYVSTDDIEIAQEAISCGANVINRPSELAQDLSLDIYGFDHFINIHDEYDYIVHLRATYPKVTADIINDACAYFEEKDEAAPMGYTSMRSMIKVAAYPSKMWHLRPDGLEAQCAGNYSHASVPRQLIPQAYKQNACIDIVKTKTIAFFRSMIGTRVLAYVMDDDADFDIDTLKDLEKNKAELT
jgi:CMP-N,N'-diacetyllegionaminic acid synthase